MKMKKYLLPVFAMVLIGFSANAQLDSTKVIDNKGTIKYVLKAVNPKIITQNDSLTLYVTPKQLGDSLNNYVQYADTAAMLINYLNSVSNGLTKTGQNVKLGGTLTDAATTITTSAGNLLKIAGLQSGSATSDSVMMVGTDGTLKRISASALFNALTFENGLTKTGNTITLGGALNQPTTITTTGTNVLKIAGLGSGTAADSLVVVGSDGTLKKITQESLLKSGEQVYTAAALQTIYNVTDMPATVSKVWVYRNGAKLIGGEDYQTSAGTVTLTVNVGPLVAAGDRIEVQWVK